MTELSATVLLSHCITVPTILTVLLLDCCTKDMVSVNFAGVALNSLLCQINSGSDFQLILTAESLALSERPDYLTISI